MRFATGDGRWAAERNGKRPAHQGFPSWQVDLADSQYWRRLLEGASFVGLNSTRPEHSRNWLAAVRMIFSLSAGISRGLIPILPHDALSGFQSIPRIDQIGSQSPSGGGVRACRPEGRGLQIHKGTLRISKVR